VVAEQGFRGRRRLGLISGRSAALDSRRTDERLSSGKLLEGRPVSASPVAELDPWTRESLIARVSDLKRERWLEQVRRTGACRHPVRLRGVVRRGGEIAVLDGR
jgi:hypothetical protein